MAMGILKAKLNHEPDEWRIESAGVWAQAGFPVAQNTQFVLYEKGIDLSTYLSCPVTEELVGGFNLILTMERGQKEALKVAFPKYAGRVYLLSEMIGLVFDIVDPVGHPLDDFRETAREIDDILTQGLDMIRQLALESPTIDAKR